MQILFANANIIFVYVLVSISNDMKEYIRSFYSMVYGTQLLIETIVTTAIYLYTFFHQINTFYVHNMRTIDPWAYIKQLIKTLIDM